MLSKGWLSDKTISFQLLVLALTVFCILSVSLFLAQLILYFIGYDVLSNPEAILDYTKPENIPAIEFMQVIYSITAFCIPPFVFAYFLGKNPLDYLGFGKKSTLITTIITILFVALLLPAINTMGALNELIDFPNFLGIEEWMQESERSATELTEVMLTMPNIGSLLFVLVMIALLPAIGEELLFRGVLQNIFINQAKNIHLGIWLSAFIFSAIHLQFYGFIPRLVLGAFFGYLLVWSGNIWYPIIGHFINNAAAVILAYLVQRGIISKEIENIGSGENMLLYGTISMAFGAILFYLFYRREKRLQATG